MKRHRKFSFDLPRLKIGAVKAFRQDAASPPSYPPPTATIEMLDSLEHIPKSVRPPLSPHTEAELRQACLNVVRDYRPSHKIPPSTQAPDVRAFAGRHPIDHGSIQAVGPAGRSALLPLPVSRANLLDDDRSPWSDKFGHNRNSMAIHSAEPRTSMHGQTKALARADLLMVGQLSDPLLPPPAQRMRPVSMAVPASTKKQLPERPTPEVNTEAVETNESTPHTDTSDYPWSEKASTAMTSAAITPARASGTNQAVAPALEVRASLPAGESPGAQSHPTVDPSETSGHKSTDISEPQSAERTSMPMPIRKPVPGPRPSASRKVSEAPRTDSRLDMTPKGQSEATSRPASRLRSRDGQNPGLTHIPPGSMANGRHFEIVRQYTLGPAQGHSEEDDRQSRPRSRSFTRQVRDYIRSASRGRGSSGIEHNAESRPQSRHRSVDSLNPDAQDRPSKWRSWTHFHKPQRSTDSLELSRPGSSNSQVRGRPGMIDPTSEPRFRPLVDLNRALPPLPSLDSWKDFANPDESSPVSKASTPHSNPLRSHPPGKLAEKSREQRPSNKRLSKSDNEMIFSRRSANFDDIKRRSRSIEIYEVPPAPASNTCASPVQMRATISGQDDLNAPHPSASLEFTPPTHNGKSLRNLRLAELEGSAVLSVDPNGSPHATSKPIGRRRLFVNTSTDIRYSREFAGGLKHKSHTTEEVEGPLPARYHAPGDKARSTLGITVDKQRRRVKSHNLTAEGWGDEVASPRQSQISAA